MKKCIHSYVLIIFLFAPIFVYAQIDTIADNVYEFNENLGIGINMPETGLHIERNVATGDNRAFIRMRNTNTGSGSFANMTIQSADKSSASGFGHTSSTYTSIPDFRNMGYIANNSNGISLYSFSNFGSLRFYTNQDGNGIIERMRINAEGNVGIGTKTPEVKLRIESNVPTGTDRALIRLRNTNSDNRSLVMTSLESFDKSTASALIHTSSTYTGIPDFDDMGAISTNGKGLSLYSRSNYGSLRFYTNLSSEGHIVERMRINAEGNIGIGTKKPMFPLHLAKVTDDAEDNTLYIQHGENGSKLAQTKDGGKLELSGQNGPDIVLSSHGDSFLNVENGNFGIGTDSPTAKLEVTSGDIYLSDINKGIIMKAPNGVCWRGTMNNDGQLAFKDVECPETSLEIASSENK